jgi:hypothetical protein
MQRPKSVTYVPEHLLPMSPVHTTVERGNGGEVSMKTFVTKAVR